MARLSVALCRLCTILLHAAWAAGAPATGLYHSRADFTRSRKARPSSLDVRRAVLSMPTGEQSYNRPFACTHFPALFHISHPRSAMTLALLLCAVDALHMTAPLGHAVARTQRAVAPTMEFGSGFGHYYSGWDDWVKEYPQADRDAYPALFSLPNDCYEVCLNKPLGIAFIENDNGGVCVDYLVEGSNAEASGVIEPGDVLIAVTAAKEFGPRWERKLLPTIDMVRHRLPGAACMACV